MPGMQIHRIITTSTTDDAHAFFWLILHEDSQLTMTCCSGWPAKHGKQGLLTIYFVCKFPDGKAVSPALRPCNFQENFSEFSGRASLPFQTDGKSRRLPNDSRLAPSSDTSACALLLLVLGAEHTGCPQALSCTKPSYWWQETFPTLYYRCREVLDPHLTHR
jgi:hypothetical protein